MLELETVKHESMQLVAQFHRGVFAGASDAWSKLNNAVAMQRLVSDQSMAVGLSYDDPQLTESASFRYDAAVLVDSATVKRAKLATLDRRTSQGMRLIELRGGSFLRAIHYGPYANISETYADLVTTAAAKGIKFEPLPLIQIYRNSPLFTDEKDLETELLVRIVDAKG